MRPHVTVKSAITLDGCIDDRSSERLLLSSPEDFAVVDALRASMDAILVGAETVRRDNPALKLRSDALRAARLAAGKSEHPAAVVLTRSGSIDFSARFFDPRESERIVVRVGATAGSLPPGVAQIRIDDGPGIIERTLEALYHRGIRSLLIEGGGTVVRQVIAAGVADRIRIAIAPRLLCDGAAPRMIPRGEEVSVPVRCKSVTMLGQMTVLDLVPLGRQLSPNP